ncbi:MAG TPA: endo-1,4-beta-xylanase [Fibrobacteria bacterium]|jgi:endo-1,4-beta-xylanase|nr:endo-1,4-beta-xylanase [Fibrobacteria bacterium]
MRSASSTPVFARFGLALALLLPALAAAQPDTLRKLADLRGIHVGAAVTFPGSNAAEYQRVLKTSFNTVVTENAMKFGSLSTSRNANGGGNYNFGPADAIVNFADTNGMKMRGHNFLWHSQAPNWFNNLTGAAASRDTTLKIMRMHIDTLGRRYKGKIYEWDVVNEGINQNGGTSPNYRTSSPWYRIGADYFDSAFVVAQRTDTGAWLVYNDFGAEGMNSKSTNVYDLVSGLKARGAPIHVLGLQSHFTFTDHDTASMGQNMRRLAALGLLLSITELDIQTSNTTDNLNTQRAKYKELMALCLSVPACKTYTAWGLNDNQSWRGASAVALLFTGTSSITPKPAYWGVVDALAEGSTVTSAPSAPWNVLAVPGISAGSAQVSWNAPGTDGRSAITAYKAVSISDTSKSCTTAGERTCVISGLPDGTHRFKVTATNAVGTSGASPFSAGSVTVGTTAVKGSVSRLAVGRFTGDYAFSLPAASAAQANALTMSILDASGRVVWEKTVRPSGGDLELSWDGTTLSGARAPTGMYIARIRAAADGAFQETVRRGVRLRD